MPHRTPSPSLLLLTLIHLATSQPLTKELLPNTQNIRSMYKKIPSSVYKQIDEDGYPEDLRPLTSTCAAANMVKIKDIDECRRAAQELGYCGNIEQYFVARNSTGHSQTVGTVNNKINPVRTDPSTWKNNSQCSTCPEFLNQKITGSVLQGIMYEAEDCNGTKPNKNKMYMDIPECQSSYHQDPEKAFSWEVSIIQKANGERASRIWKAL